MMGFTEFLFFLIPLYYAFVFSFRMKKEIKKLLSALGLGVSCSSGRGTLESIVLKASFFSPVFLPSFWFYTL